MAPVLGPSRRFKNRSALGTIASSSPTADRCELAERCPSLPTVKYRDDRPRNATRRRAPFIVWITSISIYFCFILCLHVSTDRALEQSQYNRTSFHPGSGADYQNQRVLAKDNASQSSQNESVMMKLKEKSAAKPQDSYSYHTMGAEIVHIVETRFMQGQSRLLELGLARLALFSSFCLPSMLSQTSSNFIWVIRADPDLHPAIADTMIQFLEEKDNFILIGSNSNPEGFGRTGSPFNDFLRGAPVWTGNITLVEEAYKKSADGAVLLESRLDADDGININFIKTVQDAASRNLVHHDRPNEPRQLWRLWCIHSTIEWHPLNPFPLTAKSPAANQAMSEGYLVIFSDKGLCSTPGLTFGYGLGASRASLGFEHLKHTEIVRKIPPCKDEADKVEVECVSRLTELAPGGALRARTITSAGMSNVITGDENVDSKMSALKKAGKLKSKEKILIRQFFEQKQMWALVFRYFSVNPLSAELARSIIVKRMPFIAEDNMKGQCTAGHSCKNITKALLERISDVHV